MAELWQATLGGVAMTGEPDSQGVRWGVEDVAGWDSPPLRIDDGDLTGRHGGFGSSRLYAARPVTVTGWADCPDMAAAFAVRDRLHAMMAGTLTVHESVPKSLSVVSGGPPRSSWPMDSAAPFVKFQIPLIAHDPFKRALTASTKVIGAASFGSITNTGNVPADLRITTTSPGRLVVSVGGYPPFITSWDVPVGTIVDSASTSITGPDGADLFHLVSMPPMWPVLPLGTTTVQQVGTAAISVEHFATYA